MCHSLFLTIALAAAADVSVPVTGVEAARGNPYYFVQLLTHVGIPAGLEIHRADFERKGPTHPAWLRGKQEQSAADFAKAGVVPLVSVLQVFNTSHADYRAELLDGVVVVRPIKTRTLYLDEVSPPKIASGTNIMGIAGSLFLPLDAKALPMFRAGSFSAPVGIEIDRGDSVRMTIEWKGQTVLEVLNEVVKRVAGHSWLVITSDGGASPEAFGFSHRHFTGEIQRLNQ